MVIFHQVFLMWCPDYIHFKYTKPLAFLKICRATLRTTSPCVQMEFFSTVIRTPLPLTHAGMEAISTDSRIIDLTI